MSGLRNILMSSVSDFGLLTDLLNQSGNGSSDIKIRTIFNGILSGGEYQGSYSAVATYAAGDIIGYPSDPAPLRYRANQATSAGQSPDTHPAKWDLEVGVEMIQNLGLSKYCRYSLGIRNDDMIRMNGIERGTLGTSQFTRKSSYYDVSGSAAPSTSVTSMAIPSAHPTERTIVTGTGLTIPNSASLSGTCTDSFAIPTTIPTMMTRNLPAGLGLVIGDRVTMYGDANNFFGFVIARYNNTTGVAYGGTNFYVGSGTFSSWSLKTEQLVYVQRTADPTGKNLLALVQSYDSGTGSITFKSISNTGTTTNSDWTLNFDVKRPRVVGTAGTYYNLNDNSQAVFGCSHIVTFRGNRLLHVSNKSTAGTGWLYVYGSGANDDAIPSDVEIDTYNGSTVTNQSTDTFTGLESGEHTVIAFSKVSASGSSTNTRAWIDAGTTGPTYSFREQYEYDTFTPDVTAGVLGGESFGEIAYKFRDSDGGDTTQWVPEHSNVKTTVGRANRVLTIDGVSVGLTSEDDAYMYKFRSFSSATLTQLLDIVHPQATGNMGSLAVTHTFDSRGVYYKLIITWLQAGLLETGYNNMVFLGNAWFNKVLCADEQVIDRPADSTSENLSASEESQASYLFYSTGADPLDKFVLAQYWPNPTRDWRIGGSNRGTPFIQDFAAAANAKWYPFVYSGYSFSASEVMTIEGRLYAGNKGSLILA